MKACKYLIYSLFYSRLYFIVCAVHYHAICHEYSGGSPGGEQLTRVPSGGPNSFNFMQFLGNIGKIICWCPPSRRAGAPSSGKSWIHQCEYNLVYMFPAFSYFPDSWIYMLNVHSEKLTKFMTDKL